MQVPSVLLCSDKVISIDYGSSVRTDGMGCPANEGNAPGLVFLDEDYEYGSSGAGAGGSGGAVKDTKTGNVQRGGVGVTVYPGPGANYAVSSGSGGGCPGSTLCYNQTYVNYHDESAASLQNSINRYNSGGGIIMMYAKKSIYVNGAISADGGAGNIVDVIETNDKKKSAKATSLGNGGGSGGTIICAAKILMGKGNFSASGGVGGGTTTPNLENMKTDYSGGGGAGGQIWIYSFDADKAAPADTLSDLYNYTGVVNVQGEVKG